MPSGSWRQLSGGLTAPRAIVARSRPSLSHLTAASSQVWATFPAHVKQEGLTLEGLQQLYAEVSRPASMCGTVCVSPRFC